MKTSFIKKLYFKKYDHKVAIKIANQFKQATVTTDISLTDSIVEYIVRKDWPTDDIRIMRSFGGPKYNYRIRRRSSYNTKSITLYFNNPRILKTLQTTFNGSILEIEKPKDSAHQSLLQSSDKIITRSSLFYKKFRVVCRVEPIYKKQSWNSEHIGDMEDWCRDNMQHLEKGTDWRKTGHWNASFYFKDPSNAVMFKMVFGDQIKTTERIVLLDEITEE